MTDIPTTPLLALIQRTPEWIRQDLGSKDTSVRERAEETLAAMIADALAADPARAR